ncbi:MULTISPECIES: glycosyl hydrolase [unclassified Blastococcus]
MEGAFGSWRGSEVEIAGSWSDDNEAMVHHWQLQPGAEFSSWQRPMDIAIGAIGPGETWPAAAQGAYDARWRQSLTTLRDLWGDRPATLYIRFAHESNGNWYPWSVDAGEVSAFRAAWIRFRALQQEIFPESELVFSVNRESVGSGFDWRQSFPGSQYVDVMSVDYYNQWPAVSSDAEWIASLGATDQYGAPKGLQAHLDFARSVGLPLAVSEWSGNAGQGDNPAFMRNMHAYLTAHGGSGAGQILYEILFDVPGYGGDFLLMGDTRQPATAAAYRDLF